MYIYSFLQICYKNTNTINTPDLLLEQYDNIHIYSEVEDIVVDGLKITMLPWINSENQESAVNLALMSRSLEIYSTACPQIRFAHITSDNAG